MRVFVSWHNVFHNRKRALAAIGGVTFAVLLVFLQVGFLNSARDITALLYSYLEFDLIITSDKYENLADSGTFDAVRLSQAKMAPGILWLKQFNVSRVHWLDRDADRECSLLLFGSEPDPAIYRNRSMRENIKSIAKPDAVMADVLSHADYGPIFKGRKADIDDIEVTVTSLFSLGMGFYCEGSALVNNSTFFRIMRRENRKVTFGLIKLKPGADPQAALTRLRGILPDDVLVFERSRFIEMEQDNFVSVRPVGIMFKVGAMISLMIAGVILFQVLSSDISTRLHQFATLKAMGFTTARIYAIGLEQALIYALISYLTALPLVQGVFILGSSLSKLPLELPWGVCLLVLGLTLGACGLSAVLSLGKVRRADPADLY